MQRTLFIIGAPLLALGLMRLLLPRVLAGFGGVDVSFALIACAATLVTLMLTRRAWQYVDFRALFAGGAVASLFLTIICVSAPTFWDSRATYVSPLDTFIALESFIMLMLASLEKKSDALPFYTGILLIAQLEFAKLHKAAPISS